MTYESVIRDLFLRIPELEPLYREQFSYLEGEKLPYVVLGSFVIPLLETALEDRDTESIRSVCTFLEEAAASARADAGLEQLLLVVVGEWLSGTQWEAEVAPSLGEQTKRICRYVPGLAAQRISLKGDRTRRKP